MKDVAICIRASDYSETSQIVTFFGKECGKIRAIAKGSKRPKSAFDGPIEVLSHGRIVFSDSRRERLATLTEFEQEAGFMGLRRNLLALNCCLLGAELIEGLTDDYDGHPQLYENFRQLLGDAQEAKGRKEMLGLLILFELGLLGEVGLRPNLNACANCKGQLGGERRGGYFSNSANGLVCRDCEASFPDRIAISGKCAGVLTELKQIAGCEEKTLGEIEKVLILHISGLLGRRPKMSKYVLSFQKADLEW